MIFSHKQGGASILEVLIISAIILALGMISVIALNDQQAKARDAKRISDIRQIRTALEFYYSDEGEYPIYSQAIILGQADSQKLCSKNEGGFVSNQKECLAETTYMSGVPKDPTNAKSYIYTGSSDGYDIIFETEKDSSQGQAGVYHAHAQAIDQVAGNQ